MSEVAYEDALHGRVVLTFDGRVVELFTESYGSVNRLIVGLLQVEIGGIDRRRNQSVNFVPGNKGGGFTLTVPAASWPSVEPIVKEIGTATG